MTVRVHTDRSALRSLADELGIIPGYQDQTGKEWRTTSDETRVLLLRAMGIDASTDESAESALEALHRAQRGRMLEPVCVAVQGSSAAKTLVAQLPEPEAAPVEWTLEIVEEGGASHRSTGVEPHGAGYTLTLRLPELPLGYHTARLALQTSHGPIAAAQSLIVVPSRCRRPSELLGDRKAWGLIANLYTVRSDRNWGIGDLSDLGDLLEWAGEIGADFVGVNPLHALHNRGMDVSPYSPISRLFRNVLYLDVERVPELEVAPRVREHVESPALRSDLRELRETKQVAYDRIIDLKLSLLEALHAAFLQCGDADRHRAYERWRSAREPELTEFATYMALAGARGEVDWRRWPAELRSPRSLAVDEFRRANGDRVDFHRWLQFETDRQLGEAAERARRAGLAIGLYQDLAIGTSPAGSDTWSFPGLFVQGACVGAPPDPYSATGQNWGLPPLDPRQMKEDRYRYFIRLVRAAFRHAGALRLDHVMGLFRVFWIPDGHDGNDGAYVRMPSDDLLGILALESVRNNALVVGEDLGTVPPDVPPALTKWGVLSSKVLYFERGQGGTFKETVHYAADALATANTHDMATLAGFWEGHDIELRSSVGLLESQHVRAAREERARDRRHLLAALDRAGVLHDRVDPNAAEPQISVAELRGAVHDFLALTPSVLVGVSLDDVAGEVEPVNVPGIGQEDHPSWTRRMTKSLERLREDPETEVALGSKLRQRQG